MGWLLYWPHAASGPRQPLHKQQFSGMLLMNGNIPGNDMACVALSLYAALAFPGLCHARAVTDVSFESCDERARGFRGKAASLWAEDTD